MDVFGMVVNKVITLLKEITYVVVLWENYTKKTVERRELLKSKGFNVISMKECEWNKMKKTKKVKAFLKSYNRDIIAVRWKNEWN